MTDYIEIPLYTVIDYKNNRFDKPVGFFPIFRQNDNFAEEMSKAKLLSSKGTYEADSAKWDNTLKIEAKYPQVIGNISYLFGTTKQGKAFNNTDNVFRGKASFPFYNKQRFRPYETLRDTLLSYGKYVVGTIEAYVLMTPGGARISYFTGNAYGFPQNSTSGNSNYPNNFNLKVWGIGYTDRTNVLSQVSRLGDYGYIGYLDNKIPNSPYKDGYWITLGYSSALEMLEAGGEDVQKYIDDVLATIYTHHGYNTIQIVPQGAGLWYSYDEYETTRPYLASRSPQFTPSVTAVVICDTEQEEYLMDNTLPSGRLLNLGQIAAGSSFIQVSDYGTEFSTTSGRGYYNKPNGPNGIDMRNFIKVGSGIVPKKGKYYLDYPNGGNTEPQQQKDISSGEGNYDNTNDSVEFPSVPIKTASLGGMISLWNPEIQEISQLNSYLWSPEVIDIMKKFWNDPMDGIISLSLVPIDVGATEYREVRIGGNYTGIQMKRIFNQIQKVNMGKLKFAEYFGSFADYSPYTTVYIYLPYIGMTQLNVDDIMDCDLELEYMIDLFDGTTVANLRSVRVWDGLAGIVGSWAGNCQTQIPVSSVSYREMLAGAARAGIGMLTGSMVAGAALGAQPQPQWKNNPFYVPETGEFMSYRTLEGDNTNVLNERAMGGSLQMQGVQGMNMGLNAKGQVSRGGNANCTAGALSVQTPYLIINRPVSAMPDGINDFIGYPSYSRGRLGDQQGFTQVLYVKLENLTATQKERAELDQILKGGVIF